MAKLLNLFSNFSSSIVKALVPSFSGMLRVKAGRPIVKWVIKACLLLKGRITTSDVRVSVYFVRQLYMLSRKSGIPFTVKYLKACTSLLMQAISGERHKSSQEFGAAVARTNSGLPRIIPALHRNKIREGNVSIIRLWLTLFSLYRVIDYTGDLKIKTIISPSKASINYKELREMTLNFMEDWKIPMISCSHESDELKPVPFWISTTSPNSTRSELSPGGPKTASTAIESLLGSYRAFGKAKQIRKSLMMYLTSVGQHGSNLYNVLSSSRFAERFSPTEVWDSCNGVMPIQSWYLGKLGYKVEPAGKIRVFAMVDAFTQWALAPLHIALFKRLTLLPRDATADQGTTLLRFIDHVRSLEIKRIDSYDLSAATDRLPVMAQAIVLDVLAGRDIGGAWASALVDRWYQLPINQWGTEDQRSLSFLGMPLEEAQNNPCLQVNYMEPRKEGEEGYFYVKAVKYAVGQPMGALSSWAMLALVHHIMVSIAAQRVGIRRFDLYLVLGDDLVIASPAVSRSYRALAKEWDIEINLSKSILSTNGSMEFAKRFIYKYQDVSGLSFKEMAVASHDIRGLSQLINRVSTFRVTRVSELLSFLGYGYKSLSRMTTKYRKLGERIGKALFLLSFPGERFSSLSSVQDWLMSPSFNKPGIVNFPEEGLQYLKDLVIGYADTLKQSALPRNREEWRLYIWRLMTDNNLDPNIDYQEFVPLGDEPREAEFLRGLNFTADSLEPLMMILYYDIIEKWDSTVVELKDTFEYTEDCDLDADMLWSNFDELEQIASKVDSTRGYTTITDVITLNNSAILKRAYKIRSFIRSLSQKILLSRD